MIAILDPIHSPSGRELVTMRPAWRARFGPNDVRWAFVELRNGRMLITGYPMYQVDVVRPPPDPMAGLVVGAGTGALLGAAVGGPPGALLGSIIGAVFGAGGGTAGKT